MFTVPLPSESPIDIKERLWNEFKIEVPIIEWQDRRFIRISMQAYNSPQDVERLLEGLKQVLP